MSKLLIEKLSGPMPSMKQMADWSRYWTTLDPQPSAWSFAAQLRRETRWFRQESRASRIVTLLVAQRTCPRALYYRRCSQRRAWNRWELMYAEHLFSKVGPSAKHLTTGTKARRAKNKTARSARKRNRT